MGRESLRYHGWSDFTVQSVSAPATYIMYDRTVSVSLSSDFTVQSCPWQAGPSHGQADHGLGHDARGRDWLPTADRAVGAGAARDGAAVPFRLGGATGPPPPPTIPGPGPRSAATTDGGGSAFVAGRREEEGFRAVNSSIAKMMLLMITRAVSCSCWQMLRSFCAASCVALLRWQVRVGEMSQSQFNGTEWGAKMNNADDARIRCLRIRIIRL